MGRMCLAPRYSRVRRARGSAIPSLAGRIVAAVIAAVVGAVAGVSAQTPGGVAGSALWVKANQGVQANGTNQVEQWLDQSGSGNTTTELRAAGPAHTNAVTPTSDILWVPASVNFDPAIDFSAASGRSLKGNAASNWTTGGLSIFAVTLAEGTSGGNFGGIWDALANWTTGAPGPAGAGVVHSIGASNSYYLDGNGCFVAISPTIGSTPTRIVRGVYVTGNNALNGSTFLDGVQSALGTNCGTAATTFFEVGGRTAGASTFDTRIFNGKIAEVVVFKSDLAVASDQRVESYLALKYGITLRRFNATAEDYLTSTGATVWSGLANATYHNAVAGIVADGGSGLDQRVSQSVASGDQIAIAAGSFPLPARSPRSRPPPRSATSRRSSGGTTTRAPRPTWPSPTSPRRPGRRAPHGPRLAHAGDRQRTALAGDNPHPRYADRHRESVAAQPGAADLDRRRLSTVTRTPVPLTKTGAFYFATF